MECALIISSTKSGIDYLTQMLKAVSCNDITSVKTCSESRRFMIERDFDLCIINSPLVDETGENLARSIATKGMSQVILIVRTEVFEDISLKVEDYGVITIAKPINKELFWNALKLSDAAHKKMRVMLKEDENIRKKIEDIKLIDKAKKLLILYKGMSEQQAHKHIEKTAMDKRLTKRAVADGIIETYEN